MPTDNTRKISRKKLTRNDFGLPEKSFIFCSFNNSWKISSKEFNIWMSILSKIEDSVIWLKILILSKNNLIKEAKNKNINPNRLIFAKIEMEDHLSRHKLADLFLDTFNYNGHASSCEAPAGFQ